MAAKPTEYFGSHFKFPLSQYHRPGGQHNFIVLSHTHTRTHTHIYTHTQQTPLLSLSLPLSLSLSLPPSLSSSGSGHTVLHQRDRGINLHAQRTGAGRAAYKGDRAAAVIGCNCHITARQTSPATASPQRPEALPSAALWPQSEIAPPKN